MITPLVSIITINYNNRDGLSKTIESVLSQATKNYEHIIIDGGSADGSADIIKQHQTNFSYWVSEKDAGIYEAMNKGIAAAKGDYLLFLNSGDYLSSPGIIEEVSKTLFDADIVYGNLYQDVRGRLVEIIYPDTISAKFFFTQSLPHPASFIKRTLFERLGNYNVNYKVVSDWEFFFVAVCKNNATIKHIPTIVSVYNLLGISKTNDKLNQAERQMVLNEHFKYFKDDYLKIIKIEKALYFPVKQFKRGIRLLLRIFFKINRVKATDT